MIGELIGAGVVRPGTRSASFVFCHPLLRQIAYSGTRPGWLLGAHRRAERYLAAARRPISERAYHLERSPVGATSGGSSAHGGRRAGHAARSGRCRALAAHRTRVAYRRGLRAAQTIGRSARFGRRAPGAALRVGHALGRSGEQTRAGRSSASCWPALTTRNCGARRCYSPPCWNVTWAMTPTLRRCLRPTAAPAAREAATQAPCTRPCGLSCPTRTSSTPIRSVRPSGPSRYSRRPAPAATPCVRRPRSGSSPWPGTCRRTYRGRSGTRRGRVS